MDAPSPDSGPAKAIRKVSLATSPNRIVEYCVAAGIGLLALAVSPIAIRLLTGRSELGFRLQSLSIIFVTFLLLVAGALVTRNRTRRLLFAVTACTLPIVLLALLEVIAGAVNLSDRVAMFQDLSTIKRGSNWGPGKNHLAAEKDGFVLYRPWSGQGVTINEHGLRTAAPVSRSPHEYRVAVVGSSETWGFRLADTDTIPAQLESALRDHGHKEISVYNFGIEDANLTRQLPLLRHFKDMYQIDQAIFIVGASDIYTEYFAIRGAPLDRSAAGSRIASFELYRSLQRMKSTWFDPSPETLAEFDARLAARPAGQHSVLADGLLAADSYCQTAGLRCDFVLQPLVLFRRAPRGTEPTITRTYRREYPGLNVVASRAYREARDLRLAGQIHDLTTVFDDRDEQFFVDEVHLNEAGTKALADRLAPIAATKTTAK